MTADLALGVDVGTYETKGVVTDADGRTIAQGARAHRMDVPRPGWAEHDPQGVWWDGVRDVIGQVLAHDHVSADRIAGMAVSAIGPCVVPIDGNGKPLRPAILYGVDTRSTAQIVALTETHGDATLFTRTGNRLTSQSAGPKIQWLRDEEPHVFAAARRFVTSQTYLVGHLTGRWVMDHGTAGYYDPLYNPAGRRWDTETVDIVEEERLPELGWADEIAGELTTGAAAELGLRAGTPVVVGTTDAPAEAIGSGVVSPGRMMLMYGSSIFMIGVLDQPAPDPRMWSAPFAFEDTYVLAGGTATAGTLTRWFIDLSAPDLDAADHDRLFRELTEAAAEVPAGAEGLVLLPYFSGERTPINDPLARGVLFGLNLTHGRGHIYRALLEGIAQGIRANLEVYRELGAAPDLVRAVGGGTRNRVWLQAVSDATGQVQQVVSTPGASYGDAFLASLATGLVDDRHAIDRWVIPDRESEPEPRVGDLYARQAHRARRLYEATRTLMHDVAEDV